MNERKPRVVGIVRQSTQEQAAEGRAGIARQHADIDAAQKTHNLDIIRRVEVIESGTKVRGQFDFEQVFRELREGKIDGVVCSNIDRLVRPGCFEDFSIFDHFRARKTRIFVPGEVVDPSSQSGFLVSSMRATLAGLERELILSRTGSAKEALRKMGRHADGGQTLPRGVLYAKSSRVWSYDAVESERVRRAYTLLFQGAATA